MNVGRKRGPTTFGVHLAAKSPRAKGASPDLRLWRRIRARKIINITMAIPTPPATRILAWHRKTAYSSKNVRMMKVSILILIGSVCVPVMSLRLNPLNLIAFAVSLPAYAAVAWPV